MSTKYAGGIAAGIIFHVLYYGGVAYAEVLGAFAFVAGFLAGFGGMIAWFLLAGLLSFLGCKEGARIMGAVSLAMTAALTLAFKIRMGTAPDFIAGALVLIMVGSVLFAVASETIMEKKVEAGMILFFASPGGALGTAVLAPISEAGGWALLACLCVVWVYALWKMEGAPME